MFPGQSRTVTSVRSVAHQLGVELGALIDSCQIFDMRDAYVKGELQSNRVVWKVYYKGRLSDMKMNEIRLFHQERVSHRIFHHQGHLNFLCLS